MALDIQKLTAELSDLQAAYSDREAKAAALAAATAAKADTEANGNVQLDDLKKKHADELDALTATVAAANKKAADALTAATVADQVAQQLLAQEIDYVVGLVKAEAGLVDPTPDAAPVPTTPPPVAA